ncbi:MAG: DNA-binding protein Alba [Candidatus Micrarchaeota archaeon]|nr:DNA-binding protein Alba [Candidatus Micrarchaeota archaeon]
MTEEQVEKKDDNVVFIGKKPTIGYVLAVLTQLNQGVPEVIIKARGKQICKAVTVAELVRKRYLPEVKIKDIKIDTEELTAEDGRTMRVSAIEIVVGK